MHTMKKNEKRLRELEAAIFRTWAALLRTLKEEDRMFVIKALEEWARDIEEGKA